MMFTLEGRCLSGMPCSSPDTQRLHGLDRLPPSTRFRDDLFHESKQSGRCWGDESLLPGPRANSPTFISMVDDDELVSHEAMNAETLQKNRRAGQERACQCTYLAHHGHSTVDARA